MQGVAPGSNQSGTTMYEARCSRGCAGPPMLESRIVLSVQTRGLAYPPRLKISYCRVSSRHVRKDACTSVSSGL